MARTISNYLPKSKLVHGAYYRGTCRNAEVARWAGKVFLYVRPKFGERFVEEINHPEDDHGYDVFYPFEIIEPDDHQRISDEIMESW